MIDNLQSSTDYRLYQRKSDWVRATHGVFAQVARQLSRQKHCSKQFVREVFWGRRRSVRVEQALAKIHAPGLERRAKAA